MNFFLRRLVVSFSLILVLSSVGWAAGGKQRAPSAHPSGFGVGLMVGTIDAITGKYVLPNGNAIDFGLGFMFNPWNALYGDYLFNFPGMFGSNTQFGRQSQGYFGIGGGVAFWQNRSDYCWRYYCGTSYASSSSGVFVRGFFGVEWFPAKPPFGVFAEIGPTIGIIPGFGGTIDFGTGARYFF